MSELPSQALLIPPPVLSKSSLESDHDLREVAPPDHFYCQNDQKGLIEEMNKFSKQKSGGFFDPIFERSSLACILCSQGSVCLGAYCLGSGTDPKTDKIRPCTTFPTQEFCPGLVGDVSLTSLVELRLESPQPRQTPSSVLPLGKIFGWSKSSVSISSSSKPSMSPPKSIKVSSRRRYSINVSNHCSTAVYDRNALQAFLRKCGGKSVKGKSMHRTKKFRICKTKSYSDLSSLLPPSISPSYQVPKKTCHQACKKNCHQVPNQNCHTVPKKNCYEDQEQECDQVDKHECKTVSSYLVSQHINEQSEPELLRSSPTRARPLRPSPSPPSTRPSRSSPPTRSPSATPISLVRNRSKGHTPRKETPRKKSRVQCRNKGCRDWFTSDDSRVRHETYRCKTLPEHIHVTLEGETPVPSHEDLQISPLQCRYPGCQKQYGQEAHRRRHELDRHRMLDKRGRTVSPSFPSPPLPAGASCRPQSCPPPQTDTLFLTPERPSKRRRITPASSVSSLLDSPTSPLASPTLSITPQGSDVSSSET